MRLFWRKKDPISARAQVLKAEIQSLEAQIRKLDAVLQQEAASGRSREPDRPLPSSRPNATPVFEPVERRSLEAPAESEKKASPRKEFGVRKDQPLDSWKRLKNHFRGPASSNPKLVSYLAAGSIKGLRPLRYEKRVARNRFIALFFFLMLLLCGIAAVLRSG